MLRGWLFAFLPARSSQGLAWRMSHPLSTGKFGSPITPAWGRWGGATKGKEGGVEGLQSCFDLKTTLFKGKKGL